MQRRYAAHDGADAAHSIRALSRTAINAYALTRIFPRAVAHGYKRIGANAPFRRTFNPGANAPS